MELFNRCVFRLTPTGGGVTRFLFVVAVALASARADAAPLVPQDQELLGQFYSRSSEGHLRIAGDLAAMKLQLTLSSQHIIIKGETSGLESVERLTKAVESSNQFIGDDVIAAKYISAAKARGSTVSLFRPALTAKANAILPQGTDIEKRTRSSKILSPDNMLIEFSDNRMIRSFLTRIHKITPSPFFPTDGYHNSYTNIYAGGEISRKLENSLSNSDFKEAYLRDL